MSQELSFRLAERSDFDEILKLSEGLHEGHDYLPLKYHTWMNMENLYVMLAFSGEKLASLVVCSVADEGKTCITRAARTLTEFRGRAIYKELLKAVNDFMRRKFRTILRERFTRFTDDNDTIPSFKKILVKETLAGHIEKASLRSQKIPAIDSMEIQPCTVDYLCNVILSPPQVNKLFPDNTIVIDPIPIEPVRSNIEQLLREYGGIHIAVDKSTEYTSPRSVSFGVLSPRVKYLRWTVAIHSCDPLLYEAHLLHQLKYTCEFIKDDFFFISFQHNTFTSYERKVLKELLQMKLDEDLCKCTLKLYEVAWPTS